MVHVDVLQASGTYLASCFASYACRLWLATIQKSYLHIAAALKLNATNNNSARAPRAN